MKDKQETKKFNVEEFFSNYKNLSLEETFNYFDSNVEQLLLKRLETGTINLDEVDLICKQTFKNNPKLAEIISDFVSKKIAQNKNIILEGKNAEQIKLIVKIEDYKEKVKKGNISHSELKDLCDITFGKNSEESQTIYEKMYHLVKTDEQRKYEEDQINIKKEMFQEQNKQSETKNTIK